MPELSAAQPSLGAALVGIASVVVLAWIFALGLRRLRVPGHQILGGLAAGVLLSPMIFGRVAPTTFDTLFGGSQELRVAAETADRAVSALDIAAGVALADARESRAALVAEAEAAHAAVAAAAEDQRRPLRTSLLVVAAAILATTASRGARPRRPHGSDLLLGIWCAVLPSALFLVTLRLFGDDATSTDALAVAAVMACGAWRVDREERAIARPIGDSADRAILTAGLVATGVACAGLVALAYVRGHDSLRVAAAVGCGLLGAGLLRLVPRRLVDVVAFTATSSAAALLVVVTEPPAATAILVFLLYFLLAEDGRWLGAWLGRSLSGESASVALRSALVGLNVGPSMLATAGLAAGARLLTPGSALACVIAAFFVAFFAPARLRVAQRLERPADA